MDDYAMGIFLAARRKILLAEPDEPACLCIVLSEVIFEDGGECISNREMTKLFPSFAAAYDGNHFRLGNLMEKDFEFGTKIFSCWWYPSEDPIPRIAMIDFLVGR